MINIISLSSLFIFFFFRGWLSDFIEAVLQPILINYIHHQNLRIWSIQASVVSALFLALADFGSSIYIPTLSFLVSKLFYSLVSPLSFVGPKILRDIILLNIKNLFLSISVGDQIS